MILMAYFLGRVVGFFTVVAVIVWNAVKSIILAEKIYRENGHKTSAKQVLLYIDAALVGVGGLLMLTFTMYGV